MSNANPNTSAFHSSAWTIAAKFLERGSALIVYIFLARYLSLEEFGIVTLAILYLEFISNVLNSGMFDYIVTRKKIARKMVNTCLLLTTGASIFATLILGALGTFLFAEYSESAKSIFIALLCYPVLMAYNSIQKAMIVRVQLFKRVSLLKAPSVMISGLISIYLAYSGMGAWALVVFHYLQILLDIVFMSFLVMLLPTFDFSKQEAKNSIAFSLPILLSDALNYWGSRIIELFVSLFFGPALFAVYSIARKFSKLIEQLSLVALRSVFLSYINQAENKGEEFAKFTASISFFVIPALISLGVYADHYIVYIFSEQWQGSIWVVKVIAFMAVAKCLMHHFNVFLIANDKSELVFSTNLFFFIMSLLSGALAYSLSFEYFIIVQVITFNLIALLKLLYLINRGLLSAKLVAQYFLPLLSAVIIFVAFSVAVSKLFITPYAYAPIFAFSLSIMASIGCFMVYVLFTKLCFPRFFSSALSKLAFDKKRIV